VDGILSRKGGFLSKSKGNGREVEKKSARGSKTKGIAPQLCFQSVYVYIIIVQMLNVVNNLNCVQVINKPCM
jgi:hypothetical protein